MKPNHLLFGVRHLIKRSPERGPLATAVDLRARFMECHWSCIVVDSETVKVAQSWNRPYQTLSLAEAQALLADLAVSV